MDGVDFFLVFQFYVGFLVLSSLTETGRLTAILIFCLN